MRRSGTSRFVLLTLTALAPAPLLAQAGFRPTHDRVSVGGQFGGLSGAGNLNDAGTADWRLGSAASVDGTVWLHRYVGVRASGAWAQDSIRGSAPGVVGRRKFNKWRWSVLVQAYNGPAPFGQFYRQNVSAVGVGLAFTL